MTANIGFALFLFAMALILAAMAWRMRKTDRENAGLFAASANWPTVSGTISSAMISSGGAGESGSTFEPKVDFTYSVADREYAGNRISFGRLRFVSEQKARAVLANYPVGSAATVAYDPGDPKNSILDRSTAPPAISFWTIFVLVMAAIVAALGVVMLNVTI